MHVPPHVTHLLLSLQAGEPLCVLVLTTFSSEETKVHTGGWESPFLAKVSQSLVVNRSSFPGMNKVIEYRSPDVTAVAWRTAFKASNDSH